MIDKDFTQFIARISVLHARFTAGYRMMFCDRKHKLITMAFFAIVVLLLLRSTGFFSSYSDDVSGRIAAFADGISGLLTKILLVMLIPIFVILMGTPLHAPIFEAAMREAGIRNYADQTPCLLARTEDQSNSAVSILTFASLGVPIHMIEDKKAELEAALNAYIVKMSVDRRTHSIVLHVIFADDALESAKPWDDALIPSKESVLALGTDFAGQQITVDINAQPHMLVGGSTGSGKTFLTKTLLYQLIQKGHKVVITDFKGGLDYQNAWPEHATICVDKREAKEELEKICEELAARKKLLFEHGCKDITDFNQKNPDTMLHRIIFTCDEAAMLLSKKMALDSEAKLTKEIEALVTLVATQGRALGIHLILSIQRPDATVVDGQISNNIDFRVCGRASQVLSEVVLGITDARTQVPKDGNGIFLTNEGTLFLAYRIDEDSFWTDTEHRG